MSWDLDLTWAHNMYRSDAGGCGVDWLGDRILTPIKEGGTGAQAGTGVMRLSGARPAFDLEFRNRLREIRDLLFNTNQAGKVIDEHAGLMRGPGAGPTIVEADRAQWDYNPKMADAAYSDSPGKAGQGRFYQFPLESATNAALRGSFNAAVQLLKNYVVIRGEYLDSLSSDAAIPGRPTVTYLGPTNYPANRLVFRASAYSGTSPFAAMRWRLGEVTDPTAPAYAAGDPWKYEIEPVWESGTLAAFTSEITIPASLVRAGCAYRVRLQFTDTTGRNSRWSPPVEFVAGTVEAAADLQNYLRITEVMYNPAPGGL